MHALEFITGLMAQNSDALSFIPDTTLVNRYLANGHYVIQEDRRGKSMGYILHGVPKAGQVLAISQAVIDYDYRQRGHGLLAVRSIIDRAQTNNCRALRCRCAEDLEATQFWEAAGFRHTATQYPDNRRERAIHIYMYDLWPRLF